MNNVGTASGCYCTVICWKPSSASFAINAVQRLEKNSGGASKITVAFRGVAFRMLRTMHNKVSPCRWRSQMAI